jgi:hypothetical protein
MTMAPAMAAQHGLRIPRDELDIAPSSFTVA